MKRFNWCRYQCGNLVTNTLASADQYNLLNKLCLMIFLLTNEKAKRFRSITVEQVTMVVCIRTPFSQDHTTNS